MRVSVYKGLYSDPRPVVDPNDLEADLYYSSVDYEVFNLDGTPSTGEYRGEGAVVGDRLILGDPYKHANLHEYILAKEPTADSWAKYEGFHQGIHDKRRKKTATKATADKGDWWWWGYQEAWREKLERKAAKKRTANPTDDAAEFVAVHARDVTLTPGHGRKRNPEIRVKKHSRPSGVRPIRVGEEIEIVTTQSGMDSWRPSWWRQGQRINYRVTAISPATRKRPMPLFTLDNGQTVAASQTLGRADPQKNPVDDAAEFARAHAADATWTPRIPGGTTKPPRAFNPQALVAGTLVELEHTTDPAIAMEITMDHLDRDPRHYDRELAAARRRNPSSASARRPVLRETQLSRRLKST